MSQDLCRIVICNVRSYQALNHCPLHPSCKRDCNKSPVHPNNVTSTHKYQTFHLCAIGGIHFEYQFTSHKVYHTRQMQSQTRLYSILVARVTPRVENKGLIDFEQWTLLFRTKLRGKDLPYALQRMQTGSQIITIPLQLQWTQLRGSDFPTHQVPSSQILLIHD